MLWVMFIVVLFGVVEYFYGGEDYFFFGGVLVYLGGFVMGFEEGG